MENVSVITESAVKGHPSVTARPMKAAEAEGYRYSSGNCIYLKDSRGNSVNQYSLNGNLLKWHEISGSEETVEVCWADSSCLIYRIDNKRGEDTLWFVPIAKEDEKEILGLKDRTKIRADIDSVSCILCRREDELVYTADNRIYKRNMKSGREISLKKGFQYEDDMEQDPVPCLCRRSSGAEGLKRKKGIQICVIGAVELQEEEREIRDEKIMTRMVWQL